MSQNTTHIDEAPDLRVQDEGTIFLLFYMTTRGQMWMDEHLPKDALTMGRAVVVEHRYIAEILAGARADGLVVS